MSTRREIITFFARLFIAGAVWMGSGLSTAGVVLAKMKKRILARDTDPQSLINLNPADLDTRHLPIMPLEAFDTMGDKDAPYHPARWRLELTGAVQAPVRLTYAEILDLPSVERNVLLLCPGVFVNHGRWKGISAAALINRVRPAANASKVIFHGRSKFEDRTDRYDLEELKSGRVFLAYGINGQTLPRKHGFPLRVVAEGHWGMNWTKFVYKVAFV
jgi:sulfoxide reductase catalytic subunit YedY